MVEKSVAEKARIGAGTAIAVINPAAGVVESLGLPPDVAFVDPASARLVFLFASSHAELERDMPPAIQALAPGAALWVFFRKGSRAAGIDMNRDTVWSVAESHGMRPLGLLSVDDTWSAFRLRSAD